MKKLFKLYKKLKNTFKKHKIKEILLMIIKSNSSPNQIAIGAAIGAFFSIIPTFSLGMFLALFIAWKKKLNLLSTYLGSVIVNPLNSSVVYFINYQVGSFLIGNDLPVTLPITIQNIREIAAQVYIGGIAISSILSISLYFTILFIANKIKNA